VAAGMWHTGARVPDDVRARASDPKVRLDLDTKLREAGREYEKHKGELRDAWRDLEANNRVIAGRRVRPDLDFLDQGEDGKRPPHDGKRLLDVRDLELPPAARHKPLVVVAVSGGGLRSAAWAFTVLRALEERCWGAKDGDGNPIDFPAHVRLITGASG